MKSLSLFAFVRLFFILGVASLPAFASESGGDWNVAYLNYVLSNSPPDQTTVQLGDMVLLKSNVAAWRDQLAGNPSTQSAFDGTAPTWPGGNVYYAFSTNGATAVTPSQQKAFIDATAEWPTFAKVHFYPQTTQSNYVYVQIDTNIGGGESAVGMVGGAQFFHVSPNACNRSTLVHELGHTLGLVHEHQRSDRDSYVTVFSNNVASGQLGNFVKLSNSRNQGAYDFYSVMHYSRNALSGNGLDTIEPLSQYSQYLNIIGVPGNLVLSALDRSGMAAIYGAGPTITNIVTNTLDGGVGSLRAALYYAYDHPGTTISFNIPTNDPGYSYGVFNIYVTDQLPSLANATILDASTQPAYGHVGPVVVINGSLAPVPSTYANGLRFSGTNCAARSLVINSFASCSVHFDGSTAVSNTLAGCYLGIDATGNIAVTNGFCPVLINGGAHGNLIGGSTTNARNIISGGVYQGLVIDGVGTRNNTVQGNYIGLNAAGTASLPNLYSGIAIYAGAASNLIGGTLAAQRNVISGNAEQGIYISDTNTIGNVICGNYIGLNAAGTAAISNYWAGISIYSGSQSNIIGSTLFSQRNVISGNGNQGVSVAGSGVTGNVIEGNFIGTDPTGSYAIPNGYSGVNIYGAAQSNLIGGTITGAGNLISGNLYQGVIIQDPGSSSNVVAGNLIGTDATGLNPIGNLSCGVLLYTAGSNVVGGLTASARNIISGNAAQGVGIGYAGANGNVVEGNYIGVNISGTAAISNVYSGVDIYGGAQNNIIGGFLPAAGNVISGNQIQGVALQDSGTSGNWILGNYIGLNATGLAAIPNLASGIEIFGSASGNLIGAFGARNWISGNSGNGVQLDGSGTSYNTVQANTIGLNVANQTVKNLGDGMQVFGGAVSNLIGGTIIGSANVIVSNNYNGIELFDATSTNNTIRGNSIYGAGIGIGLYNGANNYATNPVLASAVLTTNLTISGTVNNRASTQFALDFYATPATTGQGKRYLGSTNVTTSGSGSAAFTVALGAIVPLGQIITATTTDPAGNTSIFSSGVTVTGTDSVGDGIPNAWRTAFFGGAGTSTNSSSCAKCDPDHDGLSNLQEFYSGTNPSNAASALRVTNIVDNGVNVTLTFAASAGAAYRLESKDGLAQTNWNLLGDELLGKAGAMSLTNFGVGALPQRFYRLSLVP